MNLDPFIDRTIDQLMAAPVDLALLADGSSVGSIYTGAAGVAFFLYEVARLRGDAKAQKRARAWVDAASVWAGSAPPAAWRDTPDGFVMGESGLAYVRALIDGAEGDPENVEKGAARIEEASTHLRAPSPRQTRNTEYLGGAAGLVCLARDLDARLPPDPIYEAARARLRRARDNALGVLSAKYAAPLDPGPMEPLGFAHGIAGELWALVQGLGAAHPVVAARLAELAALRAIDEEGLVYWLPSRSSSDTVFLGTLCNGVPEHALLWCEVARQVGSRDAIALAGQCAESVAVLVNDDPSLCCGHAGQALALRRHAVIAGDPAAAREADERLASAVERMEAPGRTLCSLWHGALGVALEAMAWRAGETEIALFAPGRPA